MQTIENVLSTRNLTEACSEVVKNKGAGGIDLMNVGQLKSYLDLNREELCETIHGGKYIPQPIRGKEIPKRNGKTRLLGIPTVVDRMLQQAVPRVIMPQPEGEMPGHHAINSRVAQGAHMGRWKVNETEERRATGQPYQPVTVQYHVT